MNGRTRITQSRWAAFAGLLAVTLLAVPTASPAMATEAAALSVSVGAQQAQADTIEVIPLEPMEITVLRTPIGEDVSPLAVGALGEREIREGRSGMFLEEALQGLPGIQVQNRFNPAVGERVAVRGFGARAQFGLRGVRVMVDGIPATLPDGQSSLDHLDIGSLGRVEAIRGPSSALFGNAAGGVLAFHTRAPGTRPFGLEFETVGGSHGLLRTQTTATGTVNEIGYVASFSTQSWDGYRNVDPGSNFADAAGASYGAADRLGFNARVTRPLAGGELGLTVNVLDLDAENAGSIQNDFRENPDWTVNDLYLRFGTLKELSQQQAGLRWAGPLGESFDTDIAVYGVRRSIYNPIPFNVIDFDRNGGGLRAQLGRTTPTGFGSVEVQGGVEYDLQSDDRLQFAAAFGTGQPDPTDPPIVDQDERVRNAGLFLQSNVRLTGGAVLLAGLRYDNQQFRVDDRTGDGPDESGARTMDAFSPSIGASVPVAGSVSMFGSVSTVFETPTTTELKNQENQIGGFNQELDPTRGESYELGVRGRAGQRAVFELTGYQTNLRNELVPFEIAGSAGVLFMRNAGASQHRGVEATVSLADQSGLVRGDLSYTYTNARFEQYELDGEELGGNRVPGVAPQRGQALVRFGPDAWFAQVVGTYVDNVPVDDQNTASAPAYFLADVRLGLNDVSVANVTFAPWMAVTNVLDEAYIASAAVNATGSRFFEPGPGRSFQIGLRASWGAGD